MPNLADLTQTNAALAAILFGLPTAPDEDAIEGQFSVEPDANP